MQETSVCVPGKKTKVKMSSHQTGQTRLSLRSHASSYLNLTKCVVADKCCRVKSTIILSELKYKNFNPATERKYFLPLNKAEQRQTEALLVNYWSTIETIK